MIVTVTVEIDNRKLDSFEDLEEYSCQIGMQFGRAIMQAGLEMKDRQIMAGRDAKRFRDKGLRKTCIKTKCGTVEYSRRVYVDNYAQADEKKTVYLLDELMGISKIGNFSPGLCKLAASSVCESTYRGASRQISELSGQSVSAQGVWNIIQELGRREQQRAVQNAKLAKASQGVGTIETKLLYEENDGIWLHLQGESRAIHGRGKEMKVGIAYDGVLWKENRNGEKRRILNNKIAYAGFKQVREFRRNKEGLIASRFDVDGIKLRVVNGDGAGWIQKQKRKNTITVLDEYHRNRKIRECVKDPEKAKLISEVLYEENPESFMEYLDAAIDTVVDEAEKADLQELYDYYDENRASLAGYYERGIEIPPTREPGQLHHARLGSMESNVFTLIGNRMKGGRKGWSIDGANNLAIILCAYHTTGMEGLFARMPKDPQQEEDWFDDVESLKAWENPLAIGTGYDYPAGASTQGSPYWVRNIAKIGGVSELKLIY